MARSLGAGHKGAGRAGCGTGLVAQRRGTGLAGGVRKGAQAGREGDVGRAGARGKGAWHGRWARGLGVLLSCGLCTWCTQPVFDPV